MRVIPAFFFYSSVACLIPISIIYLLFLEAVFERQSCQGMRSMWSGLRGGGG